ncbi:MAG: WD40/YVTN/BNR-like repeat-containing protein [Candidatus Binatia bacterium]
MSMRRIGLSMVIYMMSIGPRQMSWAQTIDLAPLSGSLERQYWGLFFASPTAGYVLTTHEVLHTADAGQHWELRATPGGRIEQSFFLDDNAAWLYVRTADFALYRTVDGFHTLQTMSTQFQRHDKVRVGTVSQVFFLDINRGWAAGGNHVAVTTDGGQTWSGYLIPEQLGDVKRVLMFSGTDGIAQTDIGVIRTRDGGITWQAMAGAPRDTSDLQCAGQAMCMTVDVINTVQASSDGGTSWQQQSVPIDGGHIDHRDMLVNLQVVSATRAYIFGTDNHIPPIGQRQVVRPDGIFFTPKFPTTSFLITYDGTTWTRHNYDNIESIGHGQFVDDLQGWAASDENNIFRTTDGGQTWTTVQDYFRQIAALTPTPAPFVLPTPSP